MSAPEDVVELLAVAGCVAAREEAEELWELAGRDRERLSPLLERRTAGEPLAWITGSALFCDIRVTVVPGVYVPRWQSEGLARRAADLLGDGGRAVDLCTGVGAVAAVMAARRPTAEVLGTDSSASAVACARANGVDARRGDLDDPVPTDWAGTVDVLVGVVPYVPAEELHLLDRDSRAHEPADALDGGPGGTRWLAEVIVRAPRWLRPLTGVVLLELGGDQADRLVPVLGSAGLATRRIGRDEDGDVRYLEAGWS